MKNRHRRFIILASAMMGLTACSGTSHLRPRDVAEQEVAVDKEAAAERLAQAVRFQTITHNDPADTDTLAFRQLHDFLQEAFLYVHRTLKRETVSELSLLYTWPGSDTTLEPVLLMAHLDVVPVDPTGHDGWTHAPFAGTIADGYIWGRGTLDNKNGVMGVLEAVELLLREGFLPNRTVYLAFGHDEERRGTQGAAKIADLMEARGVQLAWVLDEGGFIAEGVIDGLSVPIAGVGIAEKGSLTLELVVNGGSGHASVPPQQTSIGILCRAVKRLEDRPFPARLTRVTRVLLKRLSAKLPPVQRLALQNLWAFEPLVLHNLASKPASSALVRTTTAVTMIRGGEKANVLPTSASAVVNFRLLPGDTVEGVLDRVRRVIDDERVELRPHPGSSDPSPVADVTSETYRMLEQSIREIAREEELIVAPYLVTGATDSRHFQRLADNVYRFIGAGVHRHDMDGIHGIDERIAVDEYAQAVKIYYRFIINAVGSAEAPIIASR